MSQYRAESPVQKRRIMARVGLFPDGSRGRTGRNRPRRLGRQHLRLVAPDAPLIHQPRQFEIEGCGVEAPLDLRRKVREENRQTLKTS